MVKLCIDLPEHVYKVLQYLAKITGTSESEIVHTLVESTLTGLAVMLERQLAVLHKLGLLTAHPDQVRNMLLTLKQSVEEVRRPVEESPEEKLLRILKERGEMSLGEAMEIVDPDTIIRLIERGLIIKRGTTLRLRED
ncbi:MAG: hypothetical protein GXO26_04295 [Crenarchaeota archaeon]|nr:hypothetical protein [Thermoproteota archaeon]